MTRIHPRLVLPNEPWIGIEALWALEGKKLRDAYVCLHEKRKARHIYIIGVSGSGKSVLLLHLIAHDILNGHSFSVFDLRGDLINAILELLAGYVEPSLVQFFDLREKLRPTGFHPLQGSGEPYFRAFNVFDAIAESSDSWGPQLAETLRNGLLLLSVSGCPLTDLERLFYDARFRRALITKTTEGRLHSYWSRFDEMSPDRQAALAAPVLNKISILYSTESLRRLFGNPNPVDLGAHLNRRGSVTLASLAVDELHSAGVMTGSLLLSSICREIFARVDVPESHRNPVRLYVDEFENFGMKEFESILAEGRRFKLSAVLAHQTLAQLTPKMRSIILGNAGTIIAFRTSREDAAVISRHITGDPKALELADLPTGYAYVWSQGHDPILTEINAPLIADVGQMSPLGQTYREQLKGRVPEAPRHEDPVPESEQPAEDASLEDWL